MKEIFTNAECSRLGLREGNVIEFSHGTYLVVKREPNPHAPYEDSSLVTLELQEGNG